MTSGKVAVAKTIAAALGVLLIVSLFPALTFTTCKFPENEKAKSQVRQLAIACIVYAAENDGKLPQTLGTLYPDFIDIRDDFFATDRSGKKIPIIYRGDDLEIVEGEKIPLLEWPIHFGDKKLVAYTNGHITEERVKP